MSSPGIGLISASCSAYRKTKGVPIPGVSAGSRNVGAIDASKATVNWPSGGPWAAARPSASPASTTVASTIDAVRRAMSRLPPRLAGPDDRWRVGARVADGQDLPQMTVRVLPVDVLAAQARVDRHVIRAARLAPVRNAGALEPGEDRVELRVADPEAYVQPLDLLAAGEVERRAVVEVDGREVAVRGLPRHTQQVGQALGRRDRITRRHDQVIELDRHGPPPGAAVDGRYAAKDTPALRRGTELAGRARRRGGWCRRSPGWGRTPPTARWR